MARVKHDSTSARVAKRRLKRGKKAQDLRAINRAANVIAAHCPGGIPVKAFVDPIARHWPRVPASVVIDLLVLHAAAGKVSK